MKTETSQQNMADTREDILSKLKEKLDVSEFLSNTSDLERYASDHSGFSGETPLAVLRPSSTEAMSTAMSICAWSGITMVPQGGRTGHSAGACAEHDSIVISTERMSGVISLDEEAMTMTVWAGTPLQTVHETAREKGLDYPVDFGARGTATIGGTIATNAGGIRVLRHGMTRQNVLGLEVVMADGSVISRLGKLVKDNAGFDLKQLFIGSEGTLGVVTKAVLQLKPYFPETSLAFLALPDYASALRCLASARQTFSGRLTAFEGMWPDYWDHVCHTAKLVKPPIDDRHGFYIMVEIERGKESGNTEMEDWFSTLYENGLCEDGVLAQSLSESRSLWEVREAIGEVDDSFGPHINFDLGITPSRLGDFCLACDRLVKTIEGANGVIKLGHIGDGNVHLLVGHHGDAEVIQEIEDRIYGLVSEWGGTVTAEHGVGKLKRDWLSCCRSPEEIALMRSLKTTLDPQNLLNPNVLL